MAASATQNKRGVPGRKIYENKQLPDKFAGLSLKEKLQAVAMHVYTTDREQRIRRNTVYYLMALYYQGYQNVELSAGSSAFDVYERDDYYVENQFRHQVDAVVNALSKNEGEITARPGSTSPRDIAKARVAGPVLDGQKQIVGYDRVKDQKNLYKALFGNAFIFTDYVRDEKYGSIVTPKFKYEEVPDEEGGEPFISKVPDGTTNVNRGKEVSVVCSPLEVSVIPEAKYFTDVPWILWRSKQDSELLNYMYPGLGADGGADSGNDDMAQHYLDVLANLPGNALNEGTAYNHVASQRRRAEYIRVWLTPCMYAGDKEMKRNFPEGVHVALVNGQVVDYYAEDMFRRWTHEVLIPVPHSLYGDGLYDALLVQDIINEANSLILKHVRYSTVSHKIYDATIIDPKDVVNDPANGWIPGRPSLDKTVQQAVHEVMPGQLSADVAAWLGAKLQSMQDMTSAYDPSIGKGIGANTPYSQSVFLTERAQSRWQGSLAYNRPEVIRYHQNLLKIAQTEWLEPRTFAVVANTGAWSFQEFSSADLVGEVDLVLSNTDMAPKGRAEQVQALSMAQQMGPFIMMLPPKQRLRVEEIFGLPPDSNPLSTQVSRAYRNIDRIVKGEVITPLPFVDDPQAQIPVIQDFLASEEGEDLAMSNQEAFANIYTFMSSLLMMLQGQQGFVMPGQQGAPQPGQQAPPQQGKPPGGQPGQKGGGPQAPGEAQSPAPAPAVSPAAEP